MAVPPRWTAPEVRARRWPQQLLWHSRDGVSGPGGSSPTRADGEGDHYGASDGDKGHDREEAEPYRVQFVHN
jgi:hypothetical protein